MSLQIRGEKKRFKETITFFPLNKTATTVLIRYESKKTTTISESSACAYK
jgi:hypothetical protein